MWLRRILAGTAFTALLLAAPAAARVHRVERGDTLERLGRKYGVSVLSLADANGISDHNLILAGANLVVPAATPKNAAPAPVVTPKVGMPVAPPRSATRTGPVAVPAARERLRPLFVKWAKAHGIPADLAMALAWQESGWQTGIVSSTKAVGVMQLMPATVDFTSDILLRLKTPLDPRDPDSNIRMGTRFVRYLLDRTGGNVDYALASYYQGLRAVTERGALPETERFVANVNALRGRF